MVAEVLRLRQAGQSNPCAGAWRLVHLAIDQCRAAFAFEIDHVRVLHLIVEIIALTGAFAHTSENRVTTEQFRDIVDQFLNENGFANTGTAEQANLTALCVWAEQVDHFDTGDQDFSFRRLIDKVRRRRVDRRAQFGFDRAALVNWLTNNVHDPPKRCRSDRDVDWLAHVHHSLAANETLGGVHRDGADTVFAKMLSNFEHQAVAIIVTFQGVQNVWKCAVKLNVDNSADDLAYAASRF